MLLSLIREVKEELGLDIDKESVSLLGKFWRHEFYRDDFIENELDYIYLLERNIDIREIKIQEEELEQVAWITVQQFKDMLKAKQAVYRKYVWEALFEKLKSVQL